ncbi:MAG: DUF433 domain-containing protein [Pseudomonadota bacterium]
MSVHTAFWKDRLSIPAYRVSEAAEYADISPQTISAWGRHNSQKRAATNSRASKLGLNFLELIEVAIVAELRREGVSLNRIRDARKYFSEALDSRYPFALEKFKTDGVNIFLDFSDKEGRPLDDRLVAADELGQLVWADFLQKSLREFWYDDGLAVRWYVNGEDSKVVIDPRICFGSPSIEGVMTRAIKNEWANGVAIAEIAEDYSISTEVVVEALTFEKVMVD